MKALSLRKRMSIEGFLRPLSRSDGDLGSEHSENPLDNSDGTGTITSQETFAEDGAPYGNKNAAGPHQSKGTGGHKLSPQEKERLNKRFVGMESSKGTVVTGFSVHAFDRTGGRMISAGRIEKMLKSTRTKPDKDHADRTLYDIKGSRLVLADDGTIVSVMWRNQNK